MRPTLRFRSTAALLALCFPMALGQAGMLPICPMEGGLAPAHVGAGAAMAMGSAAGDRDDSGASGSGHVHRSGGSNGTMPMPSAPHSHGHGCLCPCACSAVAGLAASPLPLSPPGAAQVASEVLPARPVALIAHRPAEHFLPFPSGPPILL